MKKIKLVKYIVVNILILATITFLCIMHIRICPIYNLFKIPCAGCGLSRAYLCLSKLEIRESFRYNILAIPLAIIYAICFFWKMYDILSEKNSLDNFINMHKISIIIVAIIFFQ